MTSDNLVRDASRVTVLREYMNDHGDCVKASAPAADRVEDLLLRWGSSPAPLVLTQGEWCPSLCGTVVLESGNRVTVQGSIDEVGYHRLLTAGGEVDVWVTPPKLPEPGRTSGVAVQLYAARTALSWGIGDFRDLRLVVDRAASARLGVVTVSPVHATRPGPGQVNSPYSPASRLFLNVLHIAPEEVPGSQEVDLSDLAAKARTLNGDRRIDRDAVWSLKQEALGLIWSHVRDELPAEFFNWSARTPHLRLFATWCAMAESDLGADWRRWPEQYRDPGDPAIAAFAARRGDLVRFHEWLQWVADVQFASACDSPVDVVADIAVGFDGSSFDAWLFQYLLESEFEIGCPSDAGNPGGQRWGLPPFNPAALAASRYAAFVDVIRSSMRHASGVRIDHVMQLWRQFWVPVNGDIHAGVYVTYPSEQLLAVIRIEAARAGCWVVGEDMGTVTGAVRSSMSDCGMLGYRSSMRTDPDACPEMAVCATTTHDQATVAGSATGLDDAAMRLAGKAFDPARTAVARKALLNGRSLPLSEASLSAVVADRCARIAASPARVALVTMEDLAVICERPNLPGTVDEYPNWRVALPRDAVSIFDEAHAQRILDEMAAR